MEKKLTKERLLKIIENSGDGTPDKIEAEFILNTLYGNEDGTHVEELSENNLEQIAGGKSSDRAVAAVLSLGLLGSSIGMRANALNESQNSINEIHSVMIGSETQKIDSKNNNKHNDENLIQNIIERISELEERINDLESSLKGREDKEIGTVAESEEWVWPAPGYHNITSGFSDCEGRSHVHGAIDIGGDARNGSIYGANIVASNDGTVIMACTDGRGGGYGNYVVIDHGNGKSTLYGHLSSVSVSKGQKVDKGQQIGNAGSTGFSTGPHLHFEYRVNGVRTNPKNILNY